MLYSYWLKEPHNLPLLSDLLAELQSACNFELMSDVLRKLTPEILGLPWVKLYRAQLCMVDCHYFQAVSILESIPQECKEYEQSRLLLAQICFLKQDYKNAIAHLQPISQSNSELALLYMRCLYFNNQLTDAIRFFNLLGRNISTECMGMAALITADAGDSLNGLALAQNTLEIAPQQPDALVAAAYCLIDLQEFDRAKPFVTAGISFCPKIGRFWSMQGQLYMIESDYLMADQSFGKAVNLMPEHVGTWLLKGWNQGLQNNWQIAIVDFERAVSLDRNFAESHAAFAVAALKLEKFEQAENALARAKRLDKHAFTVSYATALQAEAEGRIEESKKIIQDILQKPHYRGGQTYADVITRKLTEISL